jgi:putative ABC transport system permease protein
VQSFPAWLCIFKLLHQWDWRLYPKSKLTGIIFVIFASLALAAVGIYGVIAYGGVSQRTREIGVRMALGANPIDILRIVLGEALKLALAGIGIGLIASAALTRVMTSLLYGVSATDPLTFLLMPLVLSLSALLASVIPARRAARVDPMIALRTG